MAMSKLVADRTIKLATSVKSSTVLEVLVYGRYANADTIGEMLLQYGCFLQQPDSFDYSAIYFNP